MTRTLPAGSDPARAIEAIWRIESARLIAQTARIVRDVGVAEDLAQDALVAALEQWPQSGIPERPGAWLAATAKHRAIDHVRRRTVMERKQYQLVRDREDEQALAGEALHDELDDEIGDDLLRLIFVCCHPVLAREARVALTLRLIGALTTSEIAHAFLVAEATVAQRIVRAKRTLAAAKVPFEVPAGDALAQRLPAVLEVLYLIFNEGYGASAGPHLIRPELCDDAMRLGRILVALLPREPELVGLLALMELQASRLRARVNPAGEAVLLADQDRSRWDGVLVGRGLGAVARLEARLGPGPGPPLRGSYELQALIAACHARARTAADTDWARIASLYGELASLSDSPVVELNRAVAVGMAEGPRPALELVDRIARDGALAGYHLLPAVRADLLARLGRVAEARRELELAATMTDNQPARRLMLEQAAALEPVTAPEVDS
jgi:RNA polymerase sigma factor (sigma-70 family)